MAVNIPFLITKADIVSTRTGIIYQIANNISDLEIFENIEKPYLTGQLSFIDTGGILERINFTGSDIIEIDIQDAVSEDENPISLVNRKFVIDRVLAIRKADGDGTNQIDLHLMELHGWIDQVINAGIVLGGDRQEMIRRLLVEFLPPSEGPQTEPGLKLIKSAGYADVHRRYIIPENTTPLTACKTITESDTNVNGYPYFLYSAINNIGLRYQSLEQLLNEGPVLNENNPFVWNGTETSGKYGIRTFKSNKSYNYLNLARQGLWGAEYDYYDPSLGLSQNFTWVWSDAVEGYKIPDDIDQQITIRKSIMNPKFTFDDGVLSLHDTAPGRNYKEGVFAKSLMGIISETSITIGMEEARMFLSQAGAARDPRTGEVEAGVPNSITLGTKRRIVFNTSQSGVVAEDPVLSGDYFIYATRFIFKRNQGRQCTGSVILTCAKVLGDESASTNFGDV